VPHFDDMANLAAFDTFRQQLEKGFTIGGIKAFRRQELPIDRSELFFEIHDAGRKEALDRRSRLGEDAPVRGEPRSLEREHEPLGRLLAPSGKALRLLRAK
jgi:hypothetical protein